jgi:phosphohistidine phosphatase SixA
MLQIVSSFVLVTSLVSLPQPAELRRESLMEALRDGGYTIILRHARTDRSIPVKETPGYTPRERAEQRNLTADGIRDAKLIGIVLKKYRVPIGEIVSSPLYRTVETAQMAAGNPTVTTMALRVFPSTDEQAALVAEPAKKGTNRLLVTHHFVIEKHVPGIKPGDIGESEAVVVRPTAKGGIELVGRITLSDWEALAGVAPIPPSPPANPARLSGVSSVTPAQIANAYILAFNSGSTEKMREFIETYLPVNPERPLQARLDTYAETFTQYAPVTLVSAVSADSSEAVYAVKSNRGDLRLVVRASDTQSGKAASIQFVMTQGGHR